MVWRSLVFLAVLIGSPALAQDVRTLSVSGLGEVSAAPDMATIRAGVETRERRADDALRENSTLMGQVFDTLSRQGIAPADMQTSGLGLFPQFDNRSNGQGRGIAQYVAQNTLTVRVRDLDSLGAILDAINQAGINQLQGISFGMSDNSDLLNAARIAAVEDARAKAELYATAAGVTLGDLISLSEPGTTPSPRPMAMARAESMAMDVPITAGELAISARVTLIYALD